MADIVAPIDGSLIDVDWAIDITNAVNTHSATLAVSTAPIIKIKTANETVNNNATLQSDDHLFWDLNANEQFALHLTLYYASGTGPDLKFNWTYPAGTTFIWGGTFFSTTSTLTNGGPFSEAIQGEIGGTGGNACAQFYFVITVGSTAGVFQFRWAQLAATASDTTIFAGSHGILYLTI